MPKEVDWASEGVSAFQSTLPAWQVRRLPRGHGITCPRCGGKAAVNYPEWLSASKSIGRPCTYCMKVNRIPHDPST